MSTPEKGKVLPFRGREEQPEMESEPFSWTELEKAAAARKARQEAERKRKNGMITQQLRRKKP